MKRGTIALTLSASALSLALSGGVLAAGAKSGSSASSDVQRSATKESAELSKNHQVTDLMDMQVKNVQDEDLGTISELLIDDSGKVSHIVLQEGGVLGMGENRYAIPWDRVKLSPDGTVATIDVNKDRLASEFAAFEEEAIKREKEPSRSDTQPKDDSRY